MTDLIRKSDALALIERKIGKDHPALGVELHHAIAALPAVTVGVKPLVWESDGPDALTAQDYRIVADGHWFRCFGPHEIRKRPEYYPWPTLDAAKAAAQADYEARILAALEPVALTPNPVDASQTPDPAVNAPAEDAVAKGETGGETLERLGMDGAKWAAEFRTTALRLGYSDMDEGWLIGWFCNAVMAGYDRSPALDPAAIREALFSLPAVYAHQINTGVREVYDPLQRFYTMESVLAAITKATQ